MMERDAFEKLVAEGFDVIPPKFRAQIENVAIFVEDVVPEKIRREQALAPGETLLRLLPGHTADRTWQ